jgi:hypothetical protein
MKWMTKEGQIAWVRSTKWLGDYLPVAGVLSVIGIIVITVGIIL